MASSSTTIPNIEAPANEVEETIAEPVTEEEPTVQETALQDESALNDENEPLPTYDELFEEEFEEEFEEDNFDEATQTAVS